MQKRNFEPVLRIFRTLTLFLILAASGSAIGTVARTDAFYMAAHYYGLRHYAWPINYLNAIRDADIPGELAVLKSMGFNSIILLVSWSEFEPRISPDAPQYNELAFDKINRIIDSAEASGLQVILRLPYVWTLHSIGEIDPLERIALALIDHSGYRSHLLRFTRDFKQRVLARSGNVSFVFGTWEDYYVLRGLFFHDSRIRQLVKDAYTRDNPDTLDSVRTPKTKGDASLLSYVDTLILEIIKAMQGELEGYSYEVRVDDDPIVSEDDGTITWHSHQDFYHVEGADHAVTYWAPYYGATNQGERISATRALETLNWMLDRVAKQTHNPIFVDQLNFIDNTPNTEQNAKLPPGEMSEFLRGAAQLLAAKTSGYGLWTIRDYAHNILYNPAFALGLSGWEANEAVLLEAHGGVRLERGGSIKQAIPSVRRSKLGSDTAEIVVEIAGGTGVMHLQFGALARRLEVSGASLIRLEGVAPDGNSELILRVEDGSVDIASVVISGHTQVGKVIALDGAKGVHWEDIVWLNHALSMGLSAERSSTECADPQD